MSYDNANRPLCTHCPHYTYLDLETATGQPIMSRPPSCASSMADGYEALDESNICCWCDAYDDKF